MAFFAKRDVIQVNNNILPSCIRCFQKEVLKNLVFTVLPIWKSSKYAFWKSFLSNLFINSQSTAFPIQNCDKQCGSIKFSTIKIGKYLKNYPLQAITEFLLATVGVVSYNFAWHAGRAVAGQNIPIWPNIFDCFCISILVLFPSRSLAPSCNVPVSATFIWAQNFPPSGLDFQQLNYPSLAVVISAWFISSGIFSIFISRLSKFRNSRIIEVVESALNLGNIFRNIPLMFCDLFIYNGPIIYLFLCTRVSLIPGYPVP